MSEVFINHEADPYVLEIDGTLDLAGLNLQPASIVINKSVTILSQTADSSWPTGADSKQVGVCSKKGLVDAQTCKTKRSLADIQQNVLHDTAAGSKASPLNIFGTPVTGKASMDKLLCLVMLPTMQAHHYKHLSRANQPVSLGFAVDFGACSATSQHGI